MELYGNLTLVQNKYNRMCTITSDRSMNLKNFAPLLGINTNKAMSSNTATKSDNPVNINHGSEFIKIKCDAINKSEMIENGNKSDVMIILPITTTQSLKGKVPINKGVFNQFIFLVRDQNDLIVNLEFHWIFI